MGLHLLEQLNHAVLLLSLALLWAIGLPWAWTVVQHLRLRRMGLAQEARLLEAALPPDGDLPHVLVQIPTYNEGHLIHDIVTAVANFDWPHDSLHIQVLDDSSGDSVDAARAAVSAVAGRGIDAILLHREARTGFKAGALAEGLKRSQHDYVAIFDADYLPPPHFLRACMRPLLRDPRLAFVQARCDYRNARENWMTRAQQRILDAHFAVEQATRSWTGQILPFNGTCGIWRRVAIDDAGGWQADTLAEDLDLSYRVQIEGWHALFLVSVTAPGELPSTLESWRAQQSRWVKGPAEAARKLVPRLWCSRLRFGQKLLSTLTLAGSLLGPTIGVVALSLAFDLAFGAGLTPASEVLLALAASQAILAQAGMILLGQRLARGSGVISELLGLPLVLSLLIYRALANLRGVGEAMVDRSSTFVRTPKSSNPSTAVTGTLDDR
jgi:cellulose synthase/poly-beta-1,6-N-acetylglucosamine synthase-like glycosyltransferase